MISSLVGSVRSVVWRGYRISQNTVAKCATKLLKIFVFEMILTSFIKNYIQVESFS